MVVATEGEQKASHALQEAAQVIQGSPHALQLGKDILLYRQVLY